jgi:hypothetical protein
MGFSTEISARLGIDTSSVPADLAKARTAFNQELGKLPAEAAKHGAGAGDKLTRALEHKLLGARHLSGALATALGLNIEHIAETIAGGIVGGSKEAWQKAYEVADRQTAAIEKLIESRMNPKRIQEKHKKDLSRATDAAQNAGKDDEDAKAGMTAVYGSAVTKLAEIFGVAKSDAEILTEKGEKSLDLIEQQTKVGEDDKKIKEAIKSLEDARLEASTKNLNHTEKIAAFDAEIAKLVKEITGGELSQLEIIDKRKALLKVELDQEAEKQRYAQLAIDKARELGKLKTSLFEASRKYQMDEEAYQNAHDDKGKSTLGELAELSGAQGEKKKRAYKYGEDSGLSDDARAAKAKAREIEDMQDEAERLRKTGDVDGANALQDQIGSKKDELVKSGFLKSSEGDDMKKMKETLHADNLAITKILEETLTAVSGKTVNQ